MAMLSLSFVMIPLQDVQAQAATSSSGAGGGSGMDPRARVMITMSTYGAAGGALLGLASMAWGANMRAVFMGASIGLYAGILFGGYLVASHYYYRQNATTVRKDESPYSGEDFSGGDQVLSNYKTNTVHLRILSKQEQKIPLLYINLINYRF
jgi:hypothetical protein